VGGIFLRDWKLQYGSSLSAAGKSAYYSCMACIPLTLPPYSGP
jgi:hypothetical protein